MSNERWMEKLTKLDLEEKRQNKEKLKEESCCKNFQKGNKGYCKYYIGCRINIITCSEECTYK
ncbi:hypothetical protein [Clostridium algidicarnis]|uniref:hypothetical protein n=1 Tax=Clostridium algidicarnis TaxID=37659 RepID=UPI001C0CCF14|nr:hypothetical protein [Clostridium algidicarnis]MBU3205145.1 hypothetical protein [Clostridium algidicarnis]MBU3213298.1 hypothetical protein [Clostridium algidicarnis]MBU3223807.1 hypothetical protein [Clostridium algidicarnis]